MDKVDVADHLGLAGLAAKLYGSRRVGLERDDFFQEACVGLLKAAKRHDPERGAFSTYGMLWARSAILRQLSRHARPPTVSLSTPIDDDGDTTLEELLPAPGESPEAEVMVREARALLDHLPERSADVLRLRFGLAGDRELTLAEVAAKLGTSAERVRQIEMKALVKLRRVAGAYGRSASVGLSELRSAPASEAP